jgi:hypothetical protein
MISRLPILMMLDRGFFDILRNGCIDPLPARSSELWTDLVIERLTGNSNAKFDGRKFNGIGTANGIHDASWSEGSALSVNYASSEEVDVRLDHHCSRPAKPNIQASPGLIRGDLVQTVGRDVSWFGS